MKKRAKKQKFSLLRHGGIDILLTHAPARNINDGEDLPHRGFDAFNTVLDQLKPSYLLHGHIHPEYGRIERVRHHPSGTTLVNVCGAQIIDIPEDRLPARSRRLFFPVESI